MTRSVLTKIKFNDPKKSSQSIGYPVRACQCQNNLVSNPIPIITFKKVMSKNHRIFNLKRYIPVNIAQRRIEYTF